MHDTAIPNKTPAGRDEIESRARKLPANLRSILLLVDGQRTARQLRDVISGLHAPVDALDQLLLVLVDLAIGVTDAPEHFHDRQLVRVGQLPRREQHFR